MAAAEPRKKQGFLRSSWQFVVDVSLRWYFGRVGDLAASVTFWIVISFPALMLSLLAVLGPLDRAISGSVTQTLQTSVESFISRIFTGEDDAVSSTVRGLFAEGNNSLAVVSAGLALWSISRGFAGLIRALEDIYDIENRRTWYHARVVAIVLGLGSIAVPVALVLFDVYVWDRLPEAVLANSVFVMVRRAIPLVLLALWASILYHYGPAERHRWRLDLPGAVFAALGLWLLTWGFGRYVAWTSEANEVRAVVGGLLLALTWIWLAAQIFLVGGAVNFLLGERLGVARGRRAWTIGEVVNATTGEIRKVVAPETGDRPTAATTESTGAQRANEFRRDHSQPGTVGGGFVRGGELAQKPRVDTDQVAVVDPTGSPATDPGRN
jgi:membrane protein